jgi:hypothetical protein
MTNYLLHWRHPAELGRALAIGLALAVAGCNGDGALGSNEGRVRLILSRDNGGSAAGSNAAASVAAAHDDDDRDRAALMFESANVTLSSILVRTLDGVLVDVDVDLPVVVDVVEIDGGKRVQLPDGVLPADIYDQVVLVMTAVQGTTANGTVITIEPPGGGWTAVIPICPLEVLEGATATVGITLNVRNSFLRLGNRWSFEPRFRRMAECSEGGA